MAYVPIVVGRKLPRFSVGVVGGVYVPLTEKQKKGYDEKVAKRS
jgi:hypothetical protein